MTQSAYDQSALDEFFFRAFKECATGIINNLSPDANEPANATAIQVVTAQLNYDIARLVYVIDAIQARVHRQPAWVNAAVAVYDMMATSIDPAFTHPTQPIRGAFLVQHQLMRALQAQFTGMMRAQTWSVGFVQFLGQLYMAKDSIGNLTSGIVLHILRDMVDSENLFLGGNLDLYLDFVITVGPLLDTQTAEVKAAVDEIMSKLQERVSNEASATRLAFFGLMKLRESGWRSDDQFGIT
jgi:predicted DNA-binding ribbon-helix-helix protein